MLSHQKRPDPLPLAGNARNSGKVSPSIRQRQGGVRNCGNSGGQGENETAALGEGVGTGGVAHAKLGAGKERCWEKEGFRVE